MEDACENIKAEHSIDIMTEKERKAQIKAEKMANEKIPKLVLGFASTTLVALILNSFYNLTDTLFVSWGVGDYAMGGVSVVFPFVILQSAIATALGGGAASLVSRKLGEGKSTEAGEITLNAMLVFYITAALTTALGFAFLNPLLRLMGVTDELYFYAKQYFIIVLAGNVFSTGFSSIIRAEGKMLYGLLIWVIPITLNIVLDAVFILLLGWGVKGAAAATVCCQLTSFLMSVLFFKKFTTQNFKGSRLKWKRIKEIIVIGLPSLVQMGSLSFMTLLLNNVLKSASGTLGVTAFGYMSKLITFAYVPFTAVTQALAPIVGFNHGAGNIDRVKKTVSFCIILCLIYAVLAIIVAEAIPEYMIMIFTKDSAIIGIGAQGIRIVAASLVFTPLPMLLGATMQAEGKKLWAFIMYASNLIFLLPTVFLMKKYLGLDGVWLSYLIASACSTLLALVKIILNKAKENKLLNCN